ncbi:UDP-glucose 4-epimerase GalE [Dactylosporangium sp. AC04546]|uniref:UDP-glucose 4-epimerase GalE n=1 Tax=Dactylosporangium sp. AC04546 TaxID=2862460 RepID=UPI001EE03F73|nr:UDP-glucose 4-epimerase GalE [Dactylosporangium sp. AC04546]WVK88704.1 UDP-glucose 4-epimerase GalE [Dactylosporangium sp. AC04546]
MTWLVTGGAGYIGAHVVAALGAAGERVVVLDDLSTGDRNRLPLDVPLDVGDAGDPALVRAALTRHRVDGVMHLAGSKSAPDSLAQPIRYYRQNVGVVAAVLDAMVATGVTRLVFSSSAAVYGLPEAPTVTEDAPTRPLSPYGQTKLVAEQLITAAGRAHGVSWIALRYFNAVGAAAAHLGDRGTTNLLPLAFDALRTGVPLTVAGTALPTPDGSGVRDYVHVADLADAHRRAAQRLAAGRHAAVYNVGAGRGHSVLEVIRTVAEVAGAPVPTRAGPPRPGDAPQVVAAVDRIARDLGWRPRHTLRDSVASAWLARTATISPRRERPDPVRANPGPVRFAL